MNKKTKKMMENEEIMAVLSANYQNMAQSVFKWENLPKNIPTIFPEKWLYQNGMCVMFKIEETDEFAILPVAYGSVKLNIYGYPAEWRPYAVGSSVQADNIRKMILNEDNSVLIWNDPERRPTQPFIDYLVKKMVMVDDTIDINVLMQRTPFIFKGNQNNILTAKNMMALISGGENVIYKDEYDTVAVDVIQTGVPFVSDKLMDIYLEYDNRILSYLGVDNLPVEKQERMLTGETEANDEKLYLIRDARLKMRNEAVEKINKMWGLNVKVDYNDKFRDTDTQTMLDASEVGNTDTEE